MASNQPLLDDSDQDPLISLDSNETYIENQGIWGALKSSYFEWKVLIKMFPLLILFYFATWVDNWILFMGIPLVMNSLWYLVDCVLYDLLLIKAEPFESVKKTHEILTRREPVVTLKCYAYHMETRTSTDAEGRTTTHTYPVTTWEQKTAVPFDKWWDETDSLPSMAFVTLATLEYSMELQFCDETDSRIQATGERMVAENAFRDASCAYQVDMYLKEFTHKRVCFSGDKPPWFLNAKAYWTFCCLLLAWPYRIWVRARMGRSKLVVRKGISSSGL
eukprot:TRINITY_DN18615_c0_g1_i1.p1 TRINITY_DN18615_c0_g1~~TRINITY_DN18615_c0_g1_i1.p1  ORF type:complete len:298 (+),score=32.33 TRINITY_DN18615_c0_g1_i1:67-894(+)